MTKTTRNDNGNMAQLVRRTIWERVDSQRQAEEGHARLKVKVAFFYGGNGLVASTYPGWLQSAFYTLMGLFDRVGLRTNIRKTVGMACQPCRAARVQADEAYKRKMTGEGRSFKER